MKLAINRCFGGFGLSPAAVLKLYERGVKEIATHVDEYWPPEARDEEQRKYPSLSYFGCLEAWRQHLADPSPDKSSSFLPVFTPDEQFVLNEREIDRSHPELIRVVEEMGKAASGRFASIEVVEIPDGVDYEIDEYDGIEHVAEKHRTWP